MFYYFFVCLFGLFVCLFVRSFVCSFVCLIDWLILIVGLVVVGWLVILLIGQPVGRSIDWLVVGCTFFWPVRPDKPSFSAVDPFQGRNQPAYAL